MLGDRALTAAEILAEGGPEALAAAYDRLDAVYSLAVKELENSESMARRLVGDVNYSGIEIIKLRKELAQLREELLKAQKGQLEIFADFGVRLQKRIANLRGTLHDIASTFCLTCTAYKRAAQTLTEDDKHLEQ